MRTDGSRDAAGARLKRLERSTRELAARPFDVVIVGGGIHGAWAALDATRRGMSVALLEKEDFGCGASGNSHKILHGGFRYLRHGGLRRCRRSARERDTLARLAPHLVRPLPVVVPLGRGRRPGRLAMRLALLVHDLATGAFLERAHRGRLESAEWLRAAVPGLGTAGGIGAGVFRDAQLARPERLLIAVLRSAAACGATLANAVEVTGFLRDGRRVAGVVAEDRATGARLAVHARLVLNCAGGEAADLLAALGEHGPAGRFPAYQATVLVTRQLVPDVALAVPGPHARGDGDGLLRKGYRNYFVAPWRDVSLVGTFEREAGGGGPDVDDLLAEFNAASPWKLDRGDVYRAHTGRLPAEPGAGTATTAATRDRIVDHAREDGLPGLVTLAGVKWTTARFAAERAVDVIEVALGRRRVRCRTAAEPIDVGEPVPDPGSVRTSRHDPPIDPDVLRHLIDAYGSAWRRVLAYAREADDLQPLADGTPVSPAEVRHAVRAEMALRLADVAMRRTGLAETSHPGRDALRACAYVMARELDWDEARERAEVDAVDALFDGLGRPPRPDAQTMAAAEPPRAGGRNRIAALETAAADRRVPPSLARPARPRTHGAPASSGQRRPHVLMIAPTPFFTDRGCHVRIREEAKHLRRAGWDVTVCTYHHGRDVDGLPIRRTVRVPWYTKVAAGPSSHKFYVDALLLMTVLRASARRRPDVIHGHLHEGALIGAAAGALIGVPVVADFQGSLAGELLQHGFMRAGGWVHRLFAGAETFINRLPHAIVASSPAAVAAPPADGVRVTVLPDGVDAEFFQRVDGAPVRERLGIPASARVVGFLGQLTEYQGIPVLLEAVPKVVARWPDAVFLIMGYPDEERWSARAREFGVSDRCVFTGRVEYERTRDLLSACDAAVSPKLAVSEGNLKLFNYMAMELPVVASDTPVNREILGEDARYATPGDPDALAAALLDLPRDPAQLAHIGRRLRRRVLERYAWSTGADRLVEVYRSVIDRPLDAGAPAPASAGPRRSRRRAASPLREPTRAGGSR